MAFEEEKKKLVLCRYPRRLESMSPILNVSVLVLVGIKVCSDRNGHGWKFIPKNLSNSNVSFPEGVIHSFHLCLEQTCLLALQPSYKVRTYYISIYSPTQNPMDGWFVPFLPCK